MTTRCAYRSGMFDDLRVTIETQGNDEEAYENLVTVSLCGATIAFLAHDSDGVYEDLHLITSVPERFWVTRGENRAATKDQFSPAARALLCTMAEQRLWWRAQGQTCRTKDGSAQSRSAFWELLAFGLIDYHETVGSTAWLDGVCYAITAAGSAVLALRLPPSAPIRGNRGAHA